MISFDLSNCVKGPSLTDVKTSVVLSVKTFGHWVIASPMNDETPTLKCVSWFRTLGSAAGLAKAEPKHNAWCLGRIFTVATRMAALAGTSFLATGVLGYVMIGTGAALQGRVGSGVIGPRVEWSWKFPFIHVDPSTVPPQPPLENLGKVLELGGTLLYRQFWAFLTFLADGTIYRD